MYVCDWVTLAPTWHIAWVLASQPHSYACTHYTHTHGWPRTAQAGHGGTPAAASSQPYTCSYKQVKKVVQASKQATMWLVIAWAASSYYARIVASYVRTRIQRTILLASYHYVPPATAAATATRQPIMSQSLISRAQPGGGR